MSGVEFFLRNRSIPTDGSGRLLITDISLHHGYYYSTSDEEALICRSSRNVVELRSSSTFDAWYLDSEVNITTNTVNGERISEGSDDRGWINRRHVHISVEGSPFHRAVRLNRVSETALEGKFTCHIPNDSNNNKSLLILYPSEYNCATFCI